MTTITISQRHFIASRESAQELTALTRRSGEGILVEGIHFESTHDGFYFIDEFCLDLAKKVLRPPPRAQVIRFPHLKLVKKPK